MTAATRIGLIIIALMSVSAVGAQAPDLSGVSIVATPISGGIYMLEATGDVAGNIAVSVGEDGILIVDDQFEGLSGQILDALNDLHSGPLRFILNTHHHDDHSDGNAALSVATGATVIAHDQARARLMHKKASHWPTVTYAEGLTIHFNGEAIQVLAIPGGHTDNDSIVIFTNANVVHMGDLFNSGRTSFPYIDLSAGGNAIRMLENIERILPLIPADARIIAGHGPLSDRDGLVEVREMLNHTIDFVRTRRARGESLDAIKAEGFPVQYDEWNHGYTSAAEWIELIYRSLD
ncbi:MAG: MBL fold metallo-hydrolase [Proteobacteria bacterium]|nr:MBL fold metallo-hydrolase [Pseudomonadota bacterium]